MLTLKTLTLATLVGVTPALAGSYEFHAKAVPLPASPPITEKMSRGWLHGDAVLASCNAGDPQVITYLKGVLDGLDAQATATDTQTYCPKEAVQIKDVVNTVCGYLSDHPETLHYTAASDVIVALHSLKCGVQS